MVAVSEGIADGTGTPIAQPSSRKEVDSHGNVQLSGTGALGDLLAAEIRRRTRITRVRADTFGYLQRSFAGVVSEVDAREAREVGRMAVRYAGTGNGPTAASPSSASRARRTRCTYAAGAAEQGGQGDPPHARRVHQSPAGNDVTQAFLDYARPLVGPLPRIGRFKGYPVKRR